MKNLLYFEKQAEALINSTIDCRLITKSELILNLMKKYRSENNISWIAYKQTYDKWFVKYH